MELTLSPLGFWGIVVPGDILLVTANTTGKLVFLFGHRCLNAVFQILAFK